MKSLLIVRTQVYITVDTDSAPEEIREKLRGVFPEKEKERACKQDVRQELDSKAKIC